MKGNLEQNDNYVTKDASHVCGPFESGERPSEGAAAKTKCDWAQVNTMIEEGSTADQILLEHPQLAPTARGIDRLIAAHAEPPPRERDIKVFYLWGPSGCGKSHHARHHCWDDLNERYFLVTGAYTPGKLFDGYANQKVLIFDEWDSYEWPLTLMNTLLDKWECPLLARYNNKDAFWTTVIICSNMDPAKCYPAFQGEQGGSFQRRITKIMHLPPGRTQRLDWSLPDSDAPQDPAATPLPPPSTPCTPSDPDGPILPPAVPILPPYVPTADDEEFLRKVPHFRDEFIHSWQMALNNHF